MNLISVILLFQALDLYYEKSPLLLFCKCHSPKSSVYFHDEYKPSLWVGWTWIHTWFKIR